MAWRQKYAAKRMLFPLILGDDARDAEELDEAVDVVFAIDSAAFVRILVDDRGWSYDQFERWLRIILRRLFVDHS